jgi:hypothetical protein
VSKIDFDQTRTFLRALRKTSADIRLRAFYPAGHQFKAGDSGRKGPPKAQTVEQWQSEGRGVYVVINDGGDTDSAITSCRAVFCEWDDRPKDWQVTLGSSLVCLSPPSKWTLVASPFTPTGFLKSPYPLINGVPSKNASLNTLTLIAA